MRARKEQVKGRKRKAKSPEGCNFRDFLFIGIIVLNGVVLQG